MKKSSMVTLALVVALGTTGTAFAASGMPDVLSKHWAYDAVTKLAKDGIVDGYSDGNFHGDKLLNRYEMAIVVARAMSKMDKANAEDKALINKLSTEYKNELGAMGIRMDAAEKNIDRLTVHGNARVRFDKWNSDRPTPWGIDKSSISDNHINLELYGNYKVNDRWAIKSKSEWQKAMNDGVWDKSWYNAQFEELWADGSIGSTGVKLGRFWVGSPLNLVYDNKMSGVEFDFGNTIRTSVAFGKAEQWDGLTKVDYYVDNTVTKNKSFGAINFTAPLNSNTNVYLGFSRIGAKYSHFQDTTNNKAVNYYSAGFDTKLGADWTLKAAYVKSNAELDTSDHNGAVGATPDNKGWMAKIQYKGADKNVPGSYDIFAMYRKTPYLATFADTDDWDYNTKGYRVGFDYVLDKNVTLTSWYNGCKNITTNNNENKYRVELDFAF